MIEDRGSNPTRRPLTLSCWGFADAASLQRAVDQLVADDAELLPIETCQRTELYAITNGEIQLNSEARLLGEHGDAALRLFQLAAGALSCIPGERAVAVQLEHAVRTASRLGLLGPMLARLTSRAQNTAAAIRGRIEQVTPILELPDLALNRVRAVQQRFESRNKGAIRIALLGAGALARSVHAKLKSAGFTIAVWGTRRPATDRGATLSLQQAIDELATCDVVITAIADAPALLNASTLQHTIESIDLGSPGNIQSPTWSLTSIIAAAEEQLAPQRQLLMRAAHRLPALAESALAETISPSIAQVAGAIARFRGGVAETELSRLAPLLADLPPEQADRVRRAIVHTTARCLHPLHEYVNHLGRQGNSEHAATIVDHLLGSRVGWCDATDPAQDQASDRQNEHRPADNGGASALDTPTGATP